MLCAEFESDLLSMCGGRLCGTPLHRLRMVSVHGGRGPFGRRVWDLEHEKGIRWMPWHQEAMKDVARCEKPRGAASRR